MEPQGKRRKVEITKKKIEIWADSNFTGKTLIKWHQGTPNAWEEVKHGLICDLDHAIDKLKPVNP